MFIRPFFKLLFNIHERKGVFTIHSLWVLATFFVLSLLILVGLGISLDAPHRDNYFNNVYYKSLFSLIFTVYPILIMFEMFCLSEGHATTLGERIGRTVRWIYGCALKIFHPHYRPYSLYYYAYNDCQAHNNGFVSESEWSYLLHLMSKNPVNNHLDVARFSTPYHSGIPLSYVYPLRLHFFTTNITADDYMCDCQNLKDPPENTTYLNDWMAFATSQHQKNVLLSVCEPMVTESISLQTRKM